MDREKSGGLHSPGGHKESDMTEHAIQDSMLKQGPSTFYGILSLATDSPKDLGLAQESVIRTRRLSGRSERG